MQNLDAFFWGLFFCESLDLTRSCCRLAVLINPIHQYFPVYLLAGRKQPFFLAVLLPCQQVRVIVLCLIPVLLSTVCALVLRYGNGKDL